MMMELVNAPRMPRSWPSSRDTPWASRNRIATELKQNSRTCPSCAPVRSALTMLTKIRAGAKTNRYNLASGSGSMIFRQPSTKPMASITMTGAITSMAINVNCSVSIGSHFSSCFVAKSYFAE